MKELTKCCECDSFMFKENGTLTEKNDVYICDKCLEESINESNKKHTK